MAIDRRLLLKHAAAPPLFGIIPSFAWAAGENGPMKADYTLRIAPVALELAPGKTIKTTGYNGTVPGPTLRLREGRPVSINVINDAGYPASGAGRRD
jgi:FtsP/CotA-like multicopper oxidase with cupredoxin domain